MACLWLVLLSHARTSTAVNWAMAMLSREELAGHNPAVSLCKAGPELALMREEEATSVLPALPEGLGRCESAAHKCCIFPTLECSLSASWWVSARPSHKDCPFSPKLNSLLDALSGEKPGPFPLPPCVFDFGMGETWLKWRKLRFIARKCVFPR